MSPSIASSRCREPAVVRRPPRRRDWWEAAARRNRRSRRSARESPVAVRPSDAQQLGTEMFELIDRIADYRSSHEGRPPKSLRQLGVDSLTPNTIRRLAVQGRTFTVTVAYRRPAGPRGAELQCRRGRARAGRTQRGALRGLLRHAVRVRRDSRSSVDRDAVRRAAHGRLRCRRPERRGGGDQLGGVARLPAAVRRVASLRAQGKRSPAPAHRAHACLARAAIRRARPGGSSPSCCSAGSRSSRSRAGWSG